MSRLVSELGADVIDDTPQKKRKIDPRKRNYTIGLSLLAVALVGVAMIYYFASTDWLSDYANMNYITYGINTTPDTEGIYEGKITASIISVDYQSNYPSTFEIPKKIKGYPIARIEEHAFKGCKRLKKVIMHDNIVSIGQGAFINCTNLEKINFSNNLVSIGDDAFLGTKYKTNWEQQEFVQVNGILLYVNESRFLKDNNADSLILVGDSNSQYITQYPDSLPVSLTTFSVVNNGNNASDVSIKTWMEGVFKGFKKLKFVETPSYLSVVPSNSFQGCESLEKVVVSNPVTAINNYAFENCESLATVELGSGLKRIGEYAFAQDKSLVLNGLNEGVSYLGNGVFQGCESLTTFFLPSSITEIPKYAFDNTSLSSIEFEYNGASITSIEDYAFRGTLFTQFRFPKKTGFISDGVLASCPNLETVLVYDEGPARIGSNAFSLSTKFHSMKTLDASGNVLAKCVDDDTVYFPSSIKRTDDGDYGNQFESTKIKHVEINAAANSIGAQMFKDCVLLEDVTFANGSVLRSIDREAFINCIALTHVEIPNLVKSIGVGAFKNCSSLVSVKLPNASEWSESDYRVVTKKGSILATYYTTIKENMFEGCSSLTTIDIPYTVSKISDASFKGCTSLRFLFVPSSVTTISANAFANCDNIYLAIESSVIHDSYVAGWQNGIKGYALGSHELRENEDYVYSINNDQESITIIDYKKETPTSLVIPSIIDGLKVTAIKDNFLNGDNTIEEVTLPDNISSLGDGAFENCEKLNFSKSENGFNYLKTSTNEYAVIASSNVYKEDEESIFIVNENVIAVKPSALSNPQIVATVESDVKYLGSQDNNYFMLIGVDNENIVSASVNENTKIIASNSFSDLTKLESVIISNNVENVGKGAFKDCSNLSVYSTFNQKPANWDYDWNIDVEAVYWSTTGPAKITGYDACLNLDGTVRLTRNKTGDSHIVIPKTATYVENDMQIEKEITQIASGFIKNDDSVYSVYIPNTIPNVDADAFTNCSNLVIYCEASSKPAGWDDNWKDNKTPAYWDVSSTNNQTTINGVIYSVVGSNAVVSGHNSAAKSSIKIPASVTINDKSYPVTAINDKAFASASLLTSIYIPSSVTSVSDTAFYECDSLTVYFEGAATEGFKDAYSRPVYENINQNDLVQSNYIEYLITNKDEGEVTVTSYLFGLAKANIPDEIEVNSRKYKVVAVGERAFQGCSEMSAASFGQCVHTIGERAFQGCTNLQDYVIIPESVKTMGAWVFSQTFEDLEIYVVEQQKPNGWDEEWDAYDYNAESENDEIVTLYSAFGLNIVWKIDEKTNRPVLMNVEE